MLLRGRWSRAAVATTTIISMLAGLVPIAPVRSARADTAPAVAVNGQGDQYGTGGPPSMAGATAQDSTAPLAGVDLATGAATASFDFQLPVARGQAQPKLSLKYSSNAGVGLAGLGWTLDVPVIERRGASGMPQFDADVLGQNGLSDTYVFDGAPLVPICTISPSGACTGLVSGEQVPPAYAGWTYFRPEVDTGMRFFFNPNGMQWVAQTKQGVVFFFGDWGQPAGGDPPIEGIHDPLAIMSATTASGQVFRWNLALQGDLTGRDVVQYVWSRLQVAPLGGVSAAADQGREYLTDVYDTPSINVENHDVAAFAHHARLVWGPGGLPTNPPGDLRVSVLSQSPSWATPLAFALERVDVTASTWTGGTRELVRRYWLNYQPNPNNTRTSLSDIVVEGTCNQWAEDATGSLPVATNCPTLPGPSMTYTPWKIAPEPLPSVGFSAADPNSPPGPYSLIDSNGDSIPEVFAAPNAASNSAYFTYNAPGITMSSPACAGCQATIASLFGPAPPDRGNIAGGGGVESGFVLGNWWNDGQLDWLWLDISGVQALDQDSYELYSNASGTFVGQRFGSPTSPVWPGVFTSHALDFQTGRAIDVDGDGLVDMSLVPQYLTGTDYVSNAWVTARDRAGVIHPFTRQTTTNLTCLPNDLLWFGFTPANSQAVVADMDGDGLADMVVLENVQAGPSNAFGSIVAHVYKNRGDGRFGLGAANNPSCALDANASYDVNFDSNANDGTGVDSNAFATSATLHDVDGDGLADLVFVDGEGLHVSAQQWTASGYGGGDAGTVSLATLNAVMPPNGRPSSIYCFQSTPSETSFSAPIQFADMNASGVDDVYAFLCAGDNVAVDLLNGARPGLLATISNGFGLTTTLTYDRLSDPNLMSPPTVPVPVEIVTQVETANGLHGNYGRDTTVSYTYQSPVFDARDRQFLGFQTVISSTPADATGPGLDTVTRFATATCPGVAPGHPCSLGADYGWHIARGLAAVVEQHENDATSPPAPGSSGPAPGSGQILSETVNTYAYEQIYSGADGRAVRQVYVARVDQYLWDAPQTATPSPRTLLVDVGSAHAFDVSVPVSTPPEGSLGHTMKTFHQNELGNQDLRTDWGSTQKLDQPISVVTQWAIPASDQTLWAYRPSVTQTGYSVAGVLQAPVREMDYAYADPSGLPTTISAPLSGTYPLTAAPAGVASAPPPPGASKDGTVTAATIAHDAYGNITSVTLANGQCSQLKYDPQFAQFAYETDQFVGGTCGSANPLVTSRVMDRGLEVVLTELSPTNGLTTRTYDGFGRPIDVFEPDPTSSMSSDGGTSEHFDYSHYDPPSAGPAPAYPETMPSPWRVLLSQKNMGTQTAPQMAGIWDYFDASGRKLVTVRQSGSAAPQSWIVEGAQLLGTSTGRVQQAWRPSFITSFNTTLADGGSFPVDTQSSSDTFQAFAYDALGRVTHFTDEIKRTTTVKYLSSSLQERIADPIQSASGKYTLLNLNGHGQVVASQRTTSVPQSDTITTTFSYLATGELHTVQKQDTAQLASYSRTMMYDTLGRLVANEEPNTTSSTSPAVGWTYAYNDSGQLVGIRDARGCGRNIFYGPAGRMLGEDYAPCTTFPQAAYSPTWDVIYVYDTPETTTIHPEWYRGHITAIYDRAQHAQFTLDGRGRTTGLNRQVTKYATETTYAYTPHYFTRSFAYDDADRVVSATTGADVPEFVPASAAAVTTTYQPFDVAGGVTTVVSPYGNGALLTGRTFDALERPKVETYGDASGLSQTFNYYDNGPLQTLTTANAAGQSLQNLAFNYDSVDNPKTITDTASYPWPNGSLAASRALGYDDLYRLTSVTTTYGSGGSSDAFLSPPYARETTNGDLSFPYLETPPTVPARVASQSFGYDALDNMTSSDDDTHVSPDRSFGHAAYGVAGAGLVVSGQPNQFEASTGVGPGAAKIAATYDAAGNTTSVTVTRAPTSTGSSSCNGPCKSVYQYFWDEVGHLQLADRLDKNSQGNQTGAVYFEYLYDAAGTRITKTEVNEDLTGQSSAVSYHLSVFPSLRVDATAFDSNGDYERSASTETVYLQDGAGQTYGRAVYDVGSAGVKVVAGIRVYLEFGDHLGSTAFVVDHDTGGIVERPTYLAYGGAESDYRPFDWGSYREPYRYSGHEDDAEVGLIYHGARYSIPMLGRWATPDPLEIHSLASQLNPYAYAGNSPHRFVDPQGFDPEGSFNYDGSGFTFSLGGSFGGGGGGGGGSPGSTSNGWYPLLGPGTMNNTGSLALTPPAYNPGSSSSGPGTAMKLNLAPMTGPAALYGGGDIPIYAMATIVGAAVGLAVLGVCTAFQPEIFTFIDEQAVPVLTSAMVRGVTVLNTMSLAEQGIVLGAGVGGAGAVTGAAVTAADELEPAFARAVEASEAGTVTLYHGTTASSAARIAANGFRAAKDGVFFAEDFSTAAHFAQEAMAERGAIGGTVLRFTVPANIAAGMTRGILGAARGAPAIDILGGSGYEMILEAGQVGAFNAGMQEGVIDVTRLIVGF